MLAAFFRAYEALAAEQLDVTWASRDRVLSARSSTRHGTSTSTFPTGACARAGGAPAGSCSPTNGTCS